MSFPKRETKAGPFPTTDAGNEVRSSAATKREIKPIYKPWNIYNSDGEGFTISFYITLTIGGALSSSTTYIATERY